jgi:hypothetical protein
MDTSSNLTVSRSGNTLPAEYELNGMTKQLFGCTRPAELGQK